MHQFNHFKDVSLVEFKYLVFTCIPGESYCRQFRFLFLCAYDVFSVLINFVCLLLLPKCSRPHSVSDC